MLNFCLHFPYLILMLDILTVQSYPDENHSLRSVLLHVYSSMDQFWSQCFDLDKFSSF